MLLAKILLSIDCLKGCTFTCTNWHNCSLSVSGQFKKQLITHLRRYGF